MIATKDRLFFLRTTKSSENASASSYIIHHSLAKKSSKDVSALSVISHLHQWHEEEDDDNDDMMTINMTSTVKKRLA